MVTSAMTATTFLHGYLSFLRETGWNVTLVCAPGDGLVDLAREEGIALRAIPMRRDPSPLRDLVSLVRIAVLLRRLRPDVLVYATPKASLLGAVGGSIARVRTRTYEQWGLRLETATGLSSRILTAFEKLTARLSTHIVANSPSLAARIRELGLNGGKPVYVLGEGSSHGVDVEHFSPARGHGRIDTETERFLLEESARLTVGFVGRLHPDKGIDTLLEALLICADNHVPIRVVLVGSDEGALLSHQLEELRGRVAVRTVGATSDVRPYMQAMDVLVLMSKREGFPNVVLEAASLRTPAIVADSTGTVDSVVDGITGLVVRTGDAAALAEALMGLERDRPRIRQMGIEARLRVVSSFTQRVVWRLHSDFFLEARTSSYSGARADD